MLTKKMLKFSISALLLIMLFVIPGQKTFAAGITNQNSEEVTKIKPNTMTDESNTIPVYSVSLTTVTDYKKSIPVSIDAAGKLFIHLNAMDVSKGVSVNLYSSEDCSDKSKISYGTSLYDNQTDKTHTWELPKAGTYYLSFETSQSGSSVEQNLYFQLILVHSGGSLSSGKPAYGANLNNEYSYYKVTAPKTGYFTIETADASDKNYSFTVNLCNSSKKFYNQNGEYISNTAPQKTVFAVKKGTYYIAVKTSNEAFAIRQTFKAVTDNSGTSKSKAVTLSKGKTKKGILAVTDSKTAARWYKIKITKSQNVNIIFTGSSTLDPIEIEVSDGSKNIGTKRLRGIDADSSFSIYTFGNNNKLTPGTYYIKVSKGGSTTANGFYSLKFN